MKVFSYSVTYHVEDSGTIDAMSYEDARSAIEEQMYAVSPGGFSVGWDWVDFHELDEIEDDGEDEDDY